MRSSTPHSLYIGLMSGTSMDGVDAVLVDLSAGFVPAAEHHVPYPPELKRILLGLNTPGANELHVSALAANEVARLYAQAVNALLVHQCLQARDIVAVGAHGQTVRHQPGPAGVVGYTTQLLNAALLCELTGIDVVYDFRARDVAAQGQGAPLVPAFHDALFAQHEASVAVLNWGGISNLSWLPPLSLGSERVVLGFDCGPANVLLDAWCEEHTGLPFDRDGLWAAQGQIHPGLLETLLAEPYFQRSPPKSTGRDLFHRAWLHAQLEHCFGAHPRTPGPSAPDVQATLMELTARTSLDAVRSQSHSNVAAKNLIVCGGGANNTALMKRLSALCEADPLLAHTQVSTSAQWGLGVHVIEALAFAWLAYRRVLGECANAPSVTGARGYRVLGAWVKA